MKNSGLGEVLGEGSEKHLSNRVISTFSKTVKITYYKLDDEKNPI